VSDESAKQLTAHKLTRAARGTSARDTRAPRPAIRADDLGQILQLGALADAADAVAMYANAVFDFAVEGDLSAVAIAVGRAAAHADLMREILTELISRNGERNLS
jgi:hypothetical protein